MSIAGRKRLAACDSNDEGPQCLAGGDTAGQVGWGKRVELFSRATSTMQSVVLGSMNFGPERAERI